MQAQVDTQADVAAQHLVIRRNAALSWPQASVFLGSMAVLTFGIAGFFAGLGYWLILPFAGLEMLALATGLVWSLRGNAYREVVTIGPDCVRVEAGRCRVERAWEFRRAWLRIDLQAGTSGLDNSHLWLTSSGKGCEVGACLTNDERADLAQRLRELVRSGQTA